jgi:type I restriction enzyme S subunit
MIAEAEKNLPDGWATALLPEIAAIVMGQSPPGSTYNEKREGLPFFQGKADFGELHPTARKWCSAPLKFAKPGDVLISIRAPVGPTNIADQDCAIGRGLSAIGPLAGIPSKYILYAIRVQEAELAERGTGSTFTAINRDHLDGIEVRLPPLAEQQRIVAKVEALLRRVNAARQRLAKVPAILKRFRQSILSAACSGCLTADWRPEQVRSEPAAALLTRLCNGTTFPAPDGDELPDLPEAWAWATPQALATAIVDCPHSTPRWAESGRICLRTTNFRPGILDLSEIRYVSEATYQERIARLAPKSGDVVYSREGGILGIACMIPPGVTSCLGQRMMLFRVQPECAAGYFMHVLNSPLIVKRVQELTGGTASPHLNVGDVKRFPVPLPPTAEQHEIVRRVQTLFRLADAIEKRVAAATARGEKLTQAILAKAFRGELVPTEAELARREGRDYEPASILLERIRAESSAQPALAKRPRTSAS